MAKHDLFLLIVATFKTSFLKIPFRAIRTRTVEVEGEHDDQR